MTRHPKSLVIGVGNRPRITRRYAPTIRRCARGEIETDRRIETRSRFAGRRTSASIYLPRKVIRNLHRRRHRECAKIGAHVDTAVIDMLVCIRLGEIYPAVKSLSNPRTRTVGTAADDPLTTTALCTGTAEGRRLVARGTRPGYGRAVPAMRRHAEGQGTWHGPPRSGETAHRAGRRSGAADAGDHVECLAGLADVVCAEHPGAEPC